MTKSLDVLKDIYKPLKYTIIGKTTLLETTSGDFIVKESNKDLRELFNYLESRGFDYFPKVIDDTRKDVMVYEYIKDTNMPNEQKALDLINIVSLLHNKTSYYKEITEDNYKEVYENIISNINYLKEYYNNIYDLYFLEEFLRPDKYLLMCNMYMIFQALDFCQNELDEWFNLVKEEKKQRVCLIHNNLEIDHFIKGDKDYLISWDNAKNDTPILDIYNLYKKEFFNYDFDILFKEYFNKYSLNESEKKLLFILISLPSKIEVKDDNIFESCRIIREKLDYIFKTERLVRPYYSKEEKE